MSERPDDATPGAAFALLWQWRYRLLGIMALAALIGLMAAQVRPNDYRATGSMLFRFEREYFPPNIAIDGWQGEPVRTYIDGAIHTEMEILGSRRVLLAAIDALGGDPAALDDYAEAFSLRRVEGTNVARLSVEHPEPDTARRILTQIIASYFEVRTELLMSRPSGALAAAVDAAREEVLRANGALFELRQRQARSHEDPGAGTGAPQQEPPEQEARLEELRIVADASEDALRAAIGLFRQARLFERMQDDLGPVIEVLDEPYLEDDPVRLPSAASAALAALFAFTASAFLVVLLDRRGVPGGSARSGCAGAGTA